MSEVAYGFKIQQLAGADWIDTFWTNGTVTYDYCGPARLVAYEQAKRDLVCARASHPDITFRLRAVWEGLDLPDAVQNWEPLNQEKATSIQIGGDHYKSKPIQPWDAMKSWLGREQFIGYLWGSVIKYVARWKDKNGLEDLKKCRHFLDKLIEEVGNGS